jgi:hypothetical protein
LVPAAFAASRRPVVGRRVGKWDRRVGFCMDRIMNRSAFSRLAPTPYEFETHDAKDLVRLMD